MAIKSNVMGNITQIVTLLTYIVVYYNVKELELVTMLHTTKITMEKNSSESFIVEILRLISL